MKPAKPRATKKAPQPARSKPKAAKIVSAKPATKSKAADTAAHEPLDDFIDAAALALNLQIEAQWLPAVKANLQAALRQAALVDEFPLSDDTEPAPVFEA